MRGHGCEHEADEEVYHPDDGERVGAGALDQTRELLPVAAARATQTASGGERRLSREREVDFMRESWTEAGLSVRVIARRTREHTSGRQTALWDGLDGTTQVFLTNDPTIDPGDVPFEYNGRAGISSRSSPS